MPHRTFSPINSIYPFTQFAEKESDNENGTPENSDVDQKKDSAKTAALKEAIRNKLKTGGHGSSKSLSKTIKVEPTIKAEVVDVSDSGSDSDGLNNELERERRHKRKIKA